jgi:hypothetical protein
MFAKLTAGLFLAAALVSGGSSRVATQSAKDCCPNGACCYPGSPCCPAHCCSACGACCNPPQDCCAAGAPTDAGK